MTEQMEARDLFRTAYENRYTWDKNFPGYTADVTLKKGDQVYKGKARVGSDLTVEVLEVEDEQAKREILGQLQEIAIHRVRRSFEDTHGKNNFSLGETDEQGAVEIKVGGKSEGDAYKIFNNEVSMVHRHIHGIVVTIHTFSSHNTGEGYLSHRYDSVYHDPKTGEQKAPKSLFEDNYEKVGNYHILTQRIIQVPDQGEAATTELDFSNVKLLQPAMV